MDIKEIKELLEVIQSSGIEEFEMEEAGVRLRIRNASPGQAQHQGPSAQPVSNPGPAAEVALQAAPEEEQEEEDLYVFKAPIVGTFYLTPKPDAEPFVQVGEHVTNNSVVCIIEAMKIFNQIESDVSGEIVSILVENGQPVEFGEPLFEIRLSSSS
jgi:oxaloacetate decarboxylase (Na+ extruding) subunit alpha